MGLRRSQSEGSGLALILAIAAIGVGIIGWELPNNTLIKSGTNTLTIAASSVNSPTLIVYTGPPNPVKVECTVTTFTIGSANDVGLCSLFRSATFARLQASRSWDVVQTGCFGIVDPVTGGMEWDGTSCIPVYSITVTIDWRVYSS